MLRLTKLRMDFFFQRIVAQSVEVDDVTRSSILSAAQCPEANSVLFRVPGCGVSCQQFALHAQGRVKLAKKAHHSGRREGDCNHHFSLRRDIHIQVLLRNGEAVQPRSTTDTSLEPSSVTWAD